MVPAKQRSLERRLTPRKLKKAIKAAPSGTTIFCRNPKPFVCKTIRFFLGGPDDHTVVLVWIKDKPYIIEATFGEICQKKKLDDWLKEREDNTFRISPCLLDDEGYKRLNSCYGKKYDWVGVVLYMGIFRVIQFLFKKEVWLGPTNHKAQRKYFCFEMSAYIRGLDKWWMKVPKDFPTT